MAEYCAWGAWPLSSSVVKQCWHIIAFRGFPKDGRGSIMTTTNIIILLSMGQSIVLVPYWGSYYRYSDTLVHDS